MPSVTKNRSHEVQSLKSKLKSKVAQLKKVGKDLLAKTNGKNGHSTGVRLGAKTVVKGAAAKKRGRRQGRQGRQARLLLRRRQGRREQGDEESPRRQGREPGRDGQHRPAGPPGFTITTEVCTEFYAIGKKLPKALDADIRGAVARMEKLVGAKFGDPANPLLVSVRSGARASMPGMMDTILNLGLNDKTAAGLAAKSGNERFAYDSYRRFIAMYGDVVLGLKPENKEDHDPFDEILDNKKKASGVKLDSELSAEALKELVAEFKARDQGAPGHGVPRPIPTCSSRAPSRPSFSPGGTTAPTSTAA